MSKMAKLLLTACLTCPGALVLADTVLSVDLKAYKVVAAKNGKGQVVSAAEVKPADVIEYRAVYKNLSARTLQDVMGVVPIPEGLTLQPRSPLPAGAEASLDGVRFAKIPLRRSEKQPDGSIRLVDVPSSEYRAVRWGIGALPAGASKQVSVRAVVNSN